MAKKPNRRQGGRTASRKASTAKQLMLKLTAAKPAKPKPSRLAGVQKGKPDTCPPGLAMGASGWPVYSLVMADPPPEAGEKIAAVMLRQEVLERAIEQTRRRQDEQVEKDLQALASRAESRGWELPPDVARFVEDETHWLQEQERYCRTDEERRDLLTNAVTNGFLFAIERYFEALRNVPELRDRLGRIAEKRREVSRELHDRKKSKRHRFGSVTMTVAERQQAIVAEYPLLRDEIGSEAAKQALSEKYDISNRQVWNIWKTYGPETASDAS